MAKPNRPTLTIANVRPTLVDLLGSAYAEAAAVLSRAAAYWRAKDYAGVGPWFNALDPVRHAAKLGATAGAAIVDGALRGIGQAGSYASVPDAAELRPATELDVVIDCQMRWQSDANGYFLARGTQNLTSGSFRFDNHVFNGIGDLEVFLSDGTNLVQISSGAHGIPDDTRQQVRVTWRSSDGRVQFFKRATDADAWVQIGPDKVALAGATLNQAVVDPSIGALSGGSSSLLGRIYAARLATAIDGAPTLDADFTGQPDYTTSFACATGQTVTVNLGADSNDPSYLPHDGTNYLYLPAIAGNFANVPSSADLEDTTELDVAAEIAMDTWGGNFLSWVSKMRTTFSWRFMSVGTIGLGLYFSDGTAKDKTANAAHGLQPGERKWVRVTWRNTDGRYQFFLSDDGQTWAQLGTDIFEPATVGKVLRANTSPLEIGGRDNGTTDLWPGKVFRVQVRSGIDGPLALDADFTAQAGNVTTFTEGTGKTVTVNRSFAGRKAVLVERPCWLVGTDDRFEVLSDAALDPGAGDFTAVYVFRYWGLGTSQPGSMIDRKSASATAAIAGYYLVNSSGNLRGYLSDGVTQVSVDRAGLGNEPGNRILVGLRINRTAQTAETFIGASVSPAVSIAALGAITNTLALKLASLANAEVFAAAVFPEALPDADLATLAAELI